MNHLGCVCTDCYTQFHVPAIIDLVKLVKRSLWHQVYHVLDVLTHLVIYYRHFPLFGKLIWPIVFQEIIITIYIP